MALKLIEKTLYREPEPPARIRTKPMQVICPGFPRSGTESLQIALLKLGYDYTFHGWDIMFEEPHRMAAWCRLADKKFAGAPDGESNITASDFDALLGHAVAVTDAAASVFAAEMIAAYPTAKVVLNRRRDLDAWHRSAIANIGHTFENWPIWIASWFSGYGYWSLTVWSRYLWLSLFRTKDGNAAQAIRRNGKWIYREHEAMVRGLVPKERLLEWSTEDGWEVLCKVSVSFDEDEIDVLMRR